MNLRWNEETLKCSDIEVDHIEMKMGCYYDVKYCKNHLKLYKVNAKVEKI